MCNLTVSLKLIRISIQKHNHFHIFLPSAVVQRLLDLTWLEVVHFSRTRVRSALMSQSCRDIVLPSALGSGIIMLCLPRHHATQADLHGDRCARPGRTGAPRPWPTGRHDSSLQCQPTLRPDSRQQRILKRKNNISHYVVFCSVQKWRKNAEF